MNLSCVWLALAAVAGVEKATAVSPTSSPLPSSCQVLEQPKDLGYTDDSLRGWYDVSGCGVCNDYCRFVASPRYWSCKLAGTTDEYTPRDKIWSNRTATPGLSNGFDWSKCSGQGVSSTVSPTTSPIPPPTVSPTASPVPPSTVSTVTSDPSTHPTVAPSTSPVTSTSTPSVSSFPTRSPLDPINWGIPDGIYHEYLGSGKCLDIYGLEFGYYSTFSDTPIDANNCKLYKCYRDEISGFETGDITLQNGTVIHFCNCLWLHPNVDPNPTAPPDVGYHQSGRGGGFVSRSGRKQPIEPTDCPPYQGMPASTCSVYCNTRLVNTHSPTNSPTASQVPTTSLVPTNHPVATPSVSPSLSLSPTHSPTISSRPSLSSFPTRSPVDPINWGMSNAVYETLLGSGKCLDSYGLEFGYYSIFKDTPFTSQDCVAYKCWMDEVSGFEMGDITLQNGTVIHFCNCLWLHPNIDPNPTNRPDVGYHQSGRGGGFVSTSGMKQPIELTDCPPYQGMPVSSCSVNCRRRYVKTTPPTNSPTTSLLPTITPIYWKYQFKKLGDGRCTDTAGNTFGHFAPSPNNVGAPWPPGDCVLYCHAKDIDQVNGFEIMTVTYPSGTTTDYCLCNWVNPNRDPKDIVNNPGVDLRYSTPGLGSGVVHGVQFPIVVAGCPTYFGAPSNCSSTCYQRTVDTPDPTYSPTIDPTYIPTISYVPTIHPTPSPTTKSPTASPTNSPTISLVPTTTPIYWGIGNMKYIKLADGRCTDTAGNTFGHFAPYPNNQGTVWPPGDCSVYCNGKDLNQVNGFEVMTVTYLDGTTTEYCICNWVNPNQDPKNSANSSIVDLQYTTSGMGSGMVTGVSPVVVASCPSYFGVPSNCSSTCYQRLVDTPPPTSSPTVSPTASPTTTPSISPSNNPSLSPSTSPSVSPSNRPSTSPTMSPSISPSNRPSLSPTIRPTETPTNHPTNPPSVSPSVSPSNRPSTSPSMSPSSSPSNKPSMSPTISPTETPTNHPTNSPSVSPSYHPSLNPSSRPTVSPSERPSNPPTVNPTMMPTINFSGTFTPAGSGAAVDSFGNTFSSITAFHNNGPATPSTPANCATKCAELVNQYSMTNYIGCQTTEMEKNGVDEHECICLFGNAQLPPVPPEYKPQQGSGSGSIKGTDPSKVTCPQPQYDSCAAFTFAMNSATASPISAPPISSPPTNFRSYALIGPGYCADVANQLFSSIGGRLPVGGTADDCQSWCDQHPLGQLGFVISQLATMTLCYCQYDQGLPNPEPIFSPPSTVSSTQPGIGPIDRAITPDGNAMCYEFIIGDAPGPTPGATPRPTTSVPTPTPKPTDSASKSNKVTKSAKTNPPTASRSTKSSKLI